MDTTTLVDRILGDTVNALDGRFGEGYAAGNPSLVGALVRATTLYRNKPVLNRPLAVNPLVEFVRSCCVQSPTAEVEEEALFQAAGEWCAERELDAYGSRRQFRKALMKTLPQLRFTTISLPDGGSRKSQSVYRGVRLA